MAVITRDDTITLVSDKAVVDQQPTLDYEQVERIVDAAARPDADGNTVGTADWTNTYDVDAAIADAWELKAAESANRFDANIDRQGLTRSQVFDHCLKMAKMYRGRTVGRAQRTQPDSIFSRDGIWEPGIRR